MLQPLYYILHFDAYLITFASTYGIWAYLLLFFIIFCETGFILIPFLPGDSLLFSAGVIAANQRAALDIHLLLFLLIMAAIVGNKVNYLVGRLLGPRIFSSSRKGLFQRKHLESAHHFYEKHGGKAIILARFAPVFRTFVPFIAGMGAMNIRRFSIYSIISAILWVGSLLYAGYFFGNLLFIKQNLTLFIYTIIFLSFLPALLSIIYQKLFGSASSV
jgi:membrane-associated protein